LFLASGVYNFTVNANFIASLMDGHTRNGTMHKIIDIVIDKYDQYSLGDKLWEDIFGKMKMIENQAKAQNLEKDHLLSYHYKNKNSGRSKWICIRNCT